MLVGAMQEMGDLVHQHVREKDRPSEFRHPSHTVEEYFDVYAFVGQRASQCAREPVRRRLIRRAHDDRPILRLAAEAEVATPFEFTEYLLPHETNVRHVEVQKSGSLSSLWLGDQHGGTIIRVEPLAP